MAAFDVLTLDSVLKRVKVPLAADTYNLPKSVTVTGTVTSSGDVVGGGVSLAQSSVHQASTANPHSVTAQQLGAILTATKNVPNGVATTDANNEAVQLPAGAAAASFGDVLQQDGSWVHAPKSSLVATSIVSTGGTLNLTLAQAQGTVALDVTGALTANLDITIPAGFSKVLIVDNKTSGAFTLTVFTLGGAGIQIMQGSSQVVYSNGVDMEGVTAGGSGGVVANVFGRVGNVSATAGDYTAAKITNTPSGNIAATEVQAAINELDIEKLTATHGADTSNPHSVTKAQVGLSSADNTSDVNKLVSIAQQTALDLKATLGEVVNFSGVVIPAIDFALPIPAANIVDHDFFDNTQDAAWIDQCADKSWELEHISLGKQYLAANYANDAAALAAVPAIVNGDVYYTGSVFNEYGVGVTTRAGSRKHPMRGVATAEAARIIFWDITSGSPEMWMVFDRIPSASLLGWGGGVVIYNSVAIASNSLVLGSDTGIVTIDFTSDSAFVAHSTDWMIPVKPLANRNTAYTYSHGATITIANSTVNSVAITYLPDAPLDGYGMRVPTIAVGTAGGVSVIKHDGSVVNSFATASSSSVAFSKDFRLVTQAYGNEIDSFRDYVTASFAGDARYYGTSIPALIQHPANADVVVTDKYSVIANRTASILSLLYENPTTPANGMVAYLTNTYNTGWLIGDIRRAFLCNSLTADRSVKGGLLTMTGAVTETVNAGGVNVYSGFSAANYFTEAHSTDFDFGTGDFSIIMSGVKWGAASGGWRALAAMDVTSAIGSWEFVLSSTNQLVFTSNNAGTWEAITSTQTFTDAKVHHLVLSRRSGTATIYVDGVSVLSGTMAGSLTNSSYICIGALRIGGQQALVGGQLAQVRISATAPTAEQIKHMYETERKLFEPNTQALLSNSASVTDLRYDKKSGMYAVTNGTNTDLFKDLVRVDSAATGSTLATPVTTLSGNRVLAPAVDIGSELAAQVKPDKHSIIKAIAAVGGVVSLPMGYKPIGCYDVTGAALVRLTATNTAFDGFIHSVTGLTGTQTYDITLEAV